MSPSTIGESTTSSTAILCTKKKAILLCFSMSILTVAVGFTFWTAIQYNNKRLLIVVLILQILMSFIVGALAALIHGALVKRPGDLERDGSSSSSASPGSVTSTGDSAPAPEGSSSTVTLSNPLPDIARHFSIPRERCLDPSALVTTRALPTPPPYLAGGVDSPTPAYLGSTSPAKDQPPASRRSPMINEFVVQPLRIRKVHSLEISVPLDKANKSPSPQIKLVEESLTRITFFPPLEVDKTEYAEKSDFVADHEDQDDQSSATELSKEILDLMIGESNFETAQQLNGPHPKNQVEKHAIPSTLETSNTTQVTVSKTPTDALTSASNVERVEQLTPTVEIHALIAADFVSSESSEVSPTKLSTIRLVDSFLELPHKVDTVSSSRNKNEQILYHEYEAISTEELPKRLIGDSAIQATIQHTIAPTPEVEQSTSTAPVAILETSVKQHHGSLGRKWSGQPGFLNL